MKVDGEMLDFPGTAEEAAERFVQDLKCADRVIVVVEDEDGKEHEFHV